MSKLTIQSPVDNMKRLIIEAHGTETITLRLEEVHGAEGNGDGTYSETLEILGEFSLLADDVDVLKGLLQGWSYKREMEQHRADMALNHPPTGGVPC